MTVVVRNAWHHIDATPVYMDISMLPLGGYIEEMAPITERQWELLRERAKAYGYLPPKEKKCMFEHVPCP